jgi:beta-glucosidase
MGHREQRFGRHCAAGPLSRIGGGDTCIQPADGGGYADGRSDGIAVGGKSTGDFAGRYPGQECGHAIADVLFGDAEPSGRLPQTFPKRWEDNPTRSQDPEIYPGLDGVVRYDEGLFIGYRHYDREGVAPMFAFGHGLGYTSFDLSDLKVQTKGDGAQASVRVVNTGVRRGSAVVQVYVADVEASVSRPAHELKGFAKVLLGPGESREISIDLPARAFAFWDVTALGWKVEAGAFDIAVGLASDDIRATGQVVLKDWAAKP